MEVYDIKVRTLVWIKDYLLGRRQRLVASGKMSTRAAIPQGSVLGPILFILFRNDLLDALTGIVKIFANDTKLFQAVLSMSDHFFVFVTEGS